MKKNLLNSIQMAFTKSNFFDLTHDVKMSAIMGQLYPCCIVEAVPGDKFNISAESLIRFAPLVSPVMHRMDVTMHYFFVPNRIIWPGWEEFITSDPASQPPSAYPFIYLGVPDGSKSLANYLGLPVTTNVLGVNVSALPFAAYQMIYNEYYRDQNLVPAVPFELINGDNSANVADLKALRKRAWEHDYFTAALPFAQKGAPVTIPTQFQDVPVAAHDPAVPGPYGVTITSGATVFALNDPTVPTDNLMYAKTSNLAGSTSINDLRRSFRLQEWLERNARGGTRYIESILAHFGVKSSDKRLNRPEYITGTKSPVVISEVLNNSGFTDPLTGNVTPQGTMAGHGISVTAGNQGSYYCEEHGYIMGIMSIMPKTAYQQGVPRHFLKRDPLDYYWPSFAHLGEQEIQNKELYVDHATPEGTFGYIPRYTEYKFLPSRVAGDFQTNLDFWHLGRIFSTDPQLNQLFVECDPSDRVFAVNNGDDNMYCHILNKIRCSRKMPLFGTPTF